MLLIFVLLICVSAKFCGNEHYACVDDAKYICESSSNYCTNIINGVEWQYSVDGVIGCNNFQNGKGGSCHEGGVDTPGEAATCFPVHRTYCECIECSADTDCLDVKNGRGQAAGCADAHVSNSSYMQGFSAGKKCGIDNCANALKASYQQINQC